MTTVLVSFYLFAQPLSKFRRKCIFVYCPEFFLYFDLICRGQLLRGLDLPACLSFDMQLYTSPSREAQPLKMEIPVTVSLTQKIAFFGACSELTFQPMALQMVFHH